MSFVSNGMAAFNKMPSSAQSNNSDIDFNDTSCDPILDFNFENKAVNDFIKKTNKTTNPFDTSFWDESNLKNITPKKNQTVISLFGSGEVAAAKPSDTNNNPIESNSSAHESTFHGIKINHGPGMAKGGRSTHKLDFQY